MLRTSSLYALSRELQQNLPSIQGRLRQGLALWLKGTLLAHNSGQDSMAAALEMHGCHETLRWELRERSRRSGQPMSHRGRRICGQLNKLPRRQKRKRKVAAHQHSRRLSDRSTR